jgi:hypothetical protein
MRRNWLAVALLTIGSVAIAVGSAQKNPETPDNPEHIEAALKLTRRAVEEYEIHVGDKKEKPLELLKEPVMKWSNPEVGEVYGNLFLWTRESRPLLVGGLYKFFSPETYMEHEFHSLAEESLKAKFHGTIVWEPTEAGLKFVDIPKAPAPAANETQRSSQLKQLAKEFTGLATYDKNVKDTELRLLPQPIYRYAAPKQGIINGGLFAFVRATDPEIFLLIEARGKDAATARWQFAAARMNNGAELRLRYQNEQIWEADNITFNDVYVKHNRVYTTFRFEKIPEFLKDAIDKPKP